MIQIVQAGAPAKPTRLRGLGDVVHAVAQPIARGIDAVAGTRIAECQGCQRRREKLNKAVPFKQG